MTRPRPGAPGLPAWQLEAFAIDEARIAEHEDQVPAVGPSPVATFDAEVRRTADRIGARVAAAVCRCQLAPPNVVNGRCSRCWGRALPGGGTSGQAALSRDALRPGPTAEDGVG